MSIDCYKLSAVSSSYLAGIIILNWHEIVCLCLDISKCVEKCTVAEFSDNNSLSHCFSNQ